MYTRQTLQASTRLHGKLFERVVAAPMSHFDTTPSGRILHKFSKDMDEIDTVWAVNLCVCWVHTDILLE